MWFLIQEGFEGESYLKPELTGKIINAEDKRLVNCELGLMSC